MTGMAAASFTGHRGACALYLERRSLERGLGLEADDIGRLESMLERMRPAFERPGETRYRLTVKRHRGRIHVVYDTRLQCLMSAWPARSYPTHSPLITEKTP